MYFGRLARLAGLASSCGPVNSSSSLDLALALALALDLDLLEVLVFGAG
jgi:hypothetical protein